jgi:hypothetical protein
MDEGATDRTDAMLTPERERSTIADLAPSPAAPAPDPVPTPEATGVTRTTRHGPVVRIFLGPAPALATIPYDQG